MSANLGCVDFAASVQALIPGAQGRVLALLAGDEALRRRMGEAARERILERYDIKANAAVFADILSRHFE